MQERSVTNTTIHSNVIETCSVQWHHLLLRKPFVLAGLVDTHNKTGFAFSVRTGQSASMVRSWTFLGRGPGSNRGKSPHILTENFLTFAQSLRARTGSRSTRS